MKNFLKFALLSLIVMLSLQVFSQKQFVISSPPAELGLDKFCKKYSDASWIPIVSSWRVPDEAIVNVAQMTEFFLNNPLKSYDPVLYEIIGGYFSDVEFELSCHCKK